MDINALISRVMGLVTAPKQEWPKIKAESGDIKSICTNYYLPLLGLSALVQLIQKSFIGYTKVGTDASGFPTFATGTDSIPHGLIQAVVYAAFGAATVFLMSMVMEKIAPKFSCNPNRTDCFKYFAFASAIGLAGSVFSLVPWVGGLVLLVLAIYGIYVALVGIPIMTGVPAEKKWPFIIVLIICGIGVGLLLMLVSIAIHVVI